MSTAVTGCGMRGDRGPDAEHGQQALGAGREREGAGIARCRAGTQRHAVRDGNARAGPQRIGQRAGQRKAGGAAARDHDVVALGARTHCPLPRVWS